MQFAGKYEFNVVYHVGAKMAFSMLSATSSLPKKNKKHVASCI